MPLGGQKQLVLGPISDIDKIRATLAVPADLRWGVTDDSTENTISAGQCTEKGK